MMSLPKRTKAQLKSRAKRRETGWNFINVWISPESLAILNRERAKGQTLVNLVNRAIAKL